MSATETDGLEKGRRGWIWRHPLELTLCAILLAMTAVTFAQVVARYVFEAPLSWSEELARFLLMWLAMLSAAYGFKLRVHFALRLVVSACPPGVQRVVQILVTAVAALFLLAFLYLSIKFVLGVDGHIAPALRIPMEIPYASSIVGSALMLYYLLKTFWQDERHRQSSG